MKAKRTALVHFSVDNLILVDENKVSAIEFCFFFFCLFRLLFMCVRARGKTETLRILLCTKLIVVLDVLSAYLAVLPLNTF